jgi:hypothetical protein
MTLEVRQPGSRPPSCAPREGHRSFIRSTRCMRQPGTAYHRVVSVLPFASDWGPRLGHARDVGSPIEYAAHASMSCTVKRLAAPVRRPRPRAPQPSGWEPFGDVVPPSGLTKLSLKKARQPFARCDLRMLTS